MDISEAEKKKRKVLFAVALAAAYLTFDGFGFLVFVYPGLLARAQHCLQARPLLLTSLAWGGLFAASFYFWSISFGLVAWLSLSLARGVPWLAFGLPALLARRYLDRENILVQALATALGLSLVCWLLLAGLTGADWETPMGGLTAWPVALATLPWLGLTGGAFVIGFISHLLCSGLKKGFLFGLLALLLWQGVNKALFVDPSAAHYDVDLKVGLVQTGWEQDAKWDEENVRNGIERLVQLTEEAAKDGAQLVVWPETSWPIRGFRRRPSDTRKIGRLARKLEVDILASSIEEVEEGWYNSVSHIESSGRIGREYRKIRLAPFAEYLPLPSIWQTGLRKVSPFNRISRYIPGSDAAPMQSLQSRYAVLVCYESMVPDSRRMGLSELDFLVVPTNDAPFSSQLAQEAHFRSAILRAAEFRKPVLQAANTGVTGMVDKNGQVRGRTSPGFSGASVQIYTISKP